MSRANFFDQLRRYWLGQLVILGLLSLANCTVYQPMPYTMPVPYPTPVPLILPQGQGNGGMPAAPTSDFPGGDFGKGVAEGVVGNRVSDILKPKNEAPAAAGDNFRAAGRTVTAAEAAEAERAVEAGRSGMLVRGLTAGAEVVEGTALIEMAAAGLIIYGIIEYYYSPVTATH